jgi:hypothetical protein
VTQVALLTATLWFAGRALFAQWSAVRQVAHDVQPQWNWIVASGALVIVVHASLIQSWRMLLAGWGSQLRFTAAVRIWTVSNLGKYLPLKVWSIGAMGVLAQREGVSAVAAIGAALLGAMLNVGAGFGVIALSGTSVLATVEPIVRMTVLIGCVAFAVGVAVLPWMLPPVLDRVTTWRKLPATDRHLSARSLWLVTLINVVAWIGYGLAFLLFARGVTPQVSGAPGLFIAVYAVSYLAGYLFLFAPGGIGVREAFMTTLLVSFGLAHKPDALFLALASRAWLTVVEVLPGLIALPFVRRATSPVPAIIAPGSPS